MQETGNKEIRADIDLIDDSFDISQSESYHLSILTFPGRLSFCVCDTLNNRYVIQRNYPLLYTDRNSMISECKLVFEKDDLLGLCYKSCCHLLVSPYFTLVPEELFDNEETDIFLKFNHGALEGEKILHNHVKSANMYNVFSYPEEMYALLKLFQPNINLLHHTSPLINCLVTERYSTDKPVMAAYFYSGNLDIAIIKNNKLLFYNTFKIDAPEDSVYYFMLLSNSFDIELKATTIMYPGNYNHIPPEIAIINIYVESIVEIQRFKDSEIQCFELLNLELLNFKS